MFRLALLLLLASAVSAQAQSCSGAVGPKDAMRLVERCLEVSPATHPPCNAQNACAMIEDEIRRGCAQLSGADRPAYCDAY